LRGEVAELADMVRRLDDAAATAGRQPSDLRRILNVSGRIGSARGEHAFDGPVAKWVDGLTALAETLAFDTFIFWGDGDDQLERFAAEVVPATRERLV
jgi:hypothetical protein